MMRCERQRQLRSPVGGDPGVPVGSDRTPELDRCADWPGAARPDPAPAVARSQRPPSPPVADQDVLAELRQLAATHELRTPVHAILGHLDLLAAGAFGPLGSEVRACLAEMQRAGLALAERVAQLHRLADTPRAQPSVEPVWFDLTAALWAATGPWSEPAADQRSLSVLGDPVALAWLVEALAATLGARSNRAVVVQVSPALPDCAGRSLKVAWADGASLTWATSDWRLATTIMALHGGSLGRQSAQLVLTWPAWRVLERPARAQSE